MTGADGYQHSIFANLEKSTYAFGAGRTTGRYGQTARPGRTCMSRATGSPVENPTDIPLNQVTAAFALSTSACPERYNPQKQIWTVSSVCWRT